MKPFLIYGFSALVLATTSGIATAQQPLRGSTDLRPETQAAGNAPRQQTDPRALQMRQQQAQAAQNSAAAQQNLAQKNFNQAPSAPITRPFPPLTQAEDARLQQLLLAWQQQSQATKTLTCQFNKWHFDLNAAPAGVAATKSAGEIKYAKPDQGLFQTKQLLFFAGMKEGKPQFAPQAGKAGDYWVCNGREVIEFDADEKKCTVSSLPPGMQGKEIFNSPLPFVFNLDAQKIQERYWVREQKAPKEGIFLIEAWPKKQADRAQYKLVQIALDDKKFLPNALIMYAPNFNAKTAPMWDHYDFKEVKQNAIGSGIKNFLGNFVPQRPPADWTVVRETLPTQGADTQRQAEAPASQQQR